MTRLTAGLIVAALHVAIVAGMGGKLLIDRATYPRAWARSQPYDPHLPIRGRYVRLLLEAAIGPGLVLPAGTVQTNADGTVWENPPIAVPVRLAVEQDRLVALPSMGTSAIYARRSQEDAEVVAVLVQPVAYFIPDDVPDPSRREQEEELWVEVTVPPAGPPRPIRLGVRKEGVLTPLVID